MSWSLHGIPGHMKQRVFANFRLLRSAVSPRIAAVHFRTVWNGWVVEDRIKGLLTSVGKSCRARQLRCGVGQDTLQHCAVCGVYWNFLQSCLAIDISWRSKEALLGIMDGTLDNMKTRLARERYALYRTIQTCRHHQEPDTLDVKT